MPIPLTQEIAFAASRDAGNQHMRKAGRTKWNEDDYFEAARVYNELWPVARELEESLKARKEH